VGYGEFGEKIVRILERVRLRLVFLIVIISVLVVVFINKTSPLAANAEQLVTKMTIQLLERALSIKSYLQKQQNHTKIELVDQNPVDLLPEPMINYQGIVELKEAIKPGFWGFESKNRHLYYHVKNQVFFRTENSGEFIILSIYYDNNAKRLKLNKNNYQWCKVKRLWYCAQW
jgi:hypothetical protein